RYAVHHHGFAAPGEFAVAPGFRCKVHDHAAGAHALHHGSSDEPRRRTTGNLRGGYHEILPGYVPRDGFQRALLFIARLCPRVAAGSLRLTVQQVATHEACTQALYLLRCRRPHVERTHNRTKAPRGGNCLEARNTGTYHECVTRRNGTSRSREHRQQLHHARCAQEHRLVAGNRCLRRQHVHALGPRYARHTLQRKHSHPTCHDRAHVRRHPGRQQAHQRCTSGQVRNLGCIRLLHPADEVCPGKRLRRVRRHLRTSRLIIRIRKPRRYSSSSLHRYRHACLREALHCIRHESYTPLSRHCFRGNAYSHSVLGSSLYRCSRIRPPHTRCDRHRPPTMPP